MFSGFLRITPHALVAQWIEHRFPEPGCRGFDSLQVHNNAGHIMWPAFCYILYYLEMFLTELHELMILPEYALIV